MTHPENVQRDEWKLLWTLMTLPRTLHHWWQFQRRERHRRNRIQQLGSVLNHYNRSHVEGAEVSLAHSALEKLLDVAEADSDVQELMRQFQLDRSDLRRIYSELVGAGCGEQVRGHYVAASTLAYANSLSYYLNAPKHSWEDIETVARQLVLLFEKVDMRRPFRARLGRQPRA